MQQKNVEESWETIKHNLLMVVRTVILKRNKIKNKTHTPNLGENLNKKYQEKYQMVIPIIKNLERNKDICLKKRKILRDSQNGSRRKETT